MDVLKFKLKGKNAFFKIPEVNSYKYFTYGNIHKVALLGMFGAILGYGGYTQQRGNEFPEFYRKLMKLKISVVPKEGSKGYLPKKVHYFNNSAGYASQEAGGNLMVKQQWLDNPEWIIYVMLDSDEAKLLADSILNKKCVYTPYLGSNDHPADITEAELVPAEEYRGTEPIRIDGLFPAGGCALDEEDDEIIPYRYQEHLPIALTDETNMYELKKMIKTNMLITEHVFPIYQIGNTTIVFY